MSLVLLVALAALGVSAQSEAFDRIDGCRLATSYRLSERIRPTHYELTLDPDVARRRFVGQLDVSFALDRLPASQIVMQVDWRYLSVDARRIRVSVDGSARELASVCRDDKNEQLVVSLRRALPADASGRIHLEFAGSFRSDHQGLYLTEQLDTDADEREIRRLYLSTQMESTDARSVFPSFDEPKFRSTYRLRLLHPAEMRALSNAEPRESKQVAASRFSGNTQLTEFERSDELSSYLFAFALGEFEVVERRAVGRARLRLRVLAPPGRSADAGLALDAAARGVELLEREFGSVFPGAKLDLVAIPEFKAGAMENPGLMIFRPELLLFNERTSAARMKPLIIATVMHELVHQWIGHLVALDWWSDVWIKEGFAEYLAHHYAHRLYPRVGFPDIFVVDSVLAAIDADAQPSAGRVVREDLDSSLKVEATFDSAAYDKGSALVRWLHLALGDSFDALVRDLVASYSHRRVTTGELLELIGLHADERPLVRLLESWLHRASSPLLKLDYDSERNELVIEQQPLNGAHSPGRWFVFGEIALTMDEQRPELVPFELAEGCAHVRLPDGYSDQPLKLNANFSGAYRVQYSAALLANLREPIESKSLAPIERLNLANDIFSAADQTDAHLLLTYVGWFAQEDDALVLDRMFELLSAVEDRALRSRLLASWVRSAEFFYRTFGFGARDEREETYAHMLARSRVLAHLLELDFRPAVSTALELSDSQQPQPEHLRRLISATVARFGSARQFERQLARLESSESREDRTLGVRALLAGLAQLGERRTRRERAEELRSLLGGRSARVRVDGQATLLDQLAQLQR